MYLGDFAAGAIIDFKFTTRRFSTGAPHALASGDIEVYKDNGTTQKAETAPTADFDSITGLNHVRIDTSGDGTFYSAGSNFQVVISAGTVDSVSVVGEVVAHFSIAHRPLQSIGASVITATSMASDAITAAKVASDVGTEFADALLNRDMSTGTDTGSSTVRTVRQALRFLRNKWAISTGTLAVYKEDDATESWTASVSTDAAADPVTGNDPAGP